MAEKLKTYTPREEIFNAATHLAGVLFGLGAAIPLYRLAMRGNSFIFTVGIIFYWLSFLAMFGASSFYHLCRSQWHKVLARNQGRSQGDAEHR